MISVLIHIVASVCCNVQTGVRFFVENAGPKGVTVPGHFTASHNNPKTQMAPLPHLSQTP